MNYDTDNWILIKYPPGAGGKFIASCLMLFDNVAKWSKNTTTQKETVTWYKNSLPVADEIWFQKEVDTPWVLPASRLWPRGADLTNSEFWKKFNDNIDPWIQQCFNDNKFIVDFWHKQQRPPWWSHATWVNIVVDDVQLYKDLLFSKVFHYDKQTKRLTWLSQAPGLGRPTTLIYKSVFQNQWHWSDVESRDQCYNDIIIKIPGFNWNFSLIDSENCIALSDMFDVDKLETFLLKFENILKSELDTDQFRELHQSWVNATNQTMKLK
jgi:hypothetical protein